MTTLCQKLVDLGVYKSNGPGRPSLPLVYASLEEAKEAKRAYLRTLQATRREIRRSAILRGDSPPIFKRGRKPRYTSKAEATAAKRAQDKISKERYHARVLEAIDKLAAQQINHSSTESDSPWEKTSSRGKRAAHWLTGSLAPWLTGSLASLPRPTSFFSLGR